MFSAFLYLSRRALANQQRENKKINFCTENGAKKKIVW